MNVCGFDSHVVRRTHLCGPKKTKQSWKEWVFDHAFRSHVHHSGWEKVIWFFGGKRSRLILLIILEEERTIAGEVIRRFWEPEYLGKIMRRFREEVIVFSRKSKLDVDTKKGRLFYLPVSKKWSDGSEETELDASPRRNWREMKKKKTLI